MGGSKKNQTWQEFIFENLYNIQEGTEGSNKDTCSVDIFIAFSDKFKNQTPKFSRNNI